MADIEDGLLSLDTVLQVDRAKQRTPEEEQEQEQEEQEVKFAWVDLKHQRTTKWAKASTAFDEARLLVQMTCEKETIAAFEAFGAMVNLIAAKITSDKDWEIYSKSLPEREKKRMAVRNAVRKELGITQGS